MSAAPSPEAGPRLSFHVVLNPGSGKRDAGGAREAIAGVFAAAGRQCDFTSIPPGGVVAACREAARRAQLTGGALVAVGGDGTLNAAAQAAIAHGCPLGVIAQGTFNYFAREHGLPLEAAAAATALLDAEVEPVQVGLLNQRVFLVNGSLGLYPQLLRDREAAKQRLGRHRWVALLAGLRTLLGWHQRLQLEVELDGRTSYLRTSTLFVANNAMQLEQAGLRAEAEAVRRGRLAAVVARRLDAGAKLRLVWRMLRGSLADSPEVDCVTLRSLTVAVAGAGRIQAATDGEAMQLTLPVRFAVSPQPLLLLKPRGEQRR